MSQKTDSAKLIIRFKDNTDSRETDKCPVFGLSCVIMDYPQQYFFAFTSFIFFVNFISRIIPAPLLPTIEADLNISHAQAHRSG
mgnify:CR=1 FL=1